MSTFAEQQVTRLETLMAANVGIDTVEINGRMVKYADLLKQYDYWKSKVALESKARVRVSSIYLGNF